VQSCTVSSAWQGLGRGAEAHCPQTMHANPRAWPHPSPVGHGCAQSELCSSPSLPAESAVCNRRARFYYDELVKKCISCSTVCGQHPKQCDAACGGKLGDEGVEEV